LGKIIAMAIQLIKGVTGFGDGAGVVSSVSTTVGGAGGLGTVGAGAGA
jgi:hypothetical protein